VALTVVALTVALTLAVGHIRSQGAGEESHSIGPELSPPQNQAGNEVSFTPP